MAVENENNVNSQRSMGGFFNQIDDENTEDYDETNCEVNTIVSIKAGCCTFNPITPRGRMLHQLQMILLPFIPIAALVIQNSYSVANIIYKQQDVRELQLQVDSAVEMGAVLTALQQERVEVSYHAFSNGTTLRTQLQETFKVTDKAIEAVHIWPNFDQLEAVPILGTKLIFQIHLKNLREDINGGDVEILKEKMNYYTSVSTYIMEAMIRSIKDTNLSNIWKLMIAYKDMIRAVEYFGVTIVEGLSFFSEGSLNSGTYINYVTHDALAWKTLNQTKDFVTIIRDKLNNMTHHYENFENVIKWRSRIIENVGQAVDLREADDYYYSMVKLSDKLREMQKILLELIKEYMMQELESADTKAMLSIILLSLVLSISPIIIFLIKNASITIQACALSMTNRTNQLKRERRRCNRLLCQILPPKTVGQLKEKNEVPDERFDSATVYFFNIVGMTKVTSEIGPDETVNFISNVWSMLESCIKKYDVYKPNVIGNSYMVISGVPERNGDRHVEEIARLGLDLNNAFSQFVVPHKPNKRLAIRSGFHSGPVVAGIIGRTIPRYCVFGSTIQIARKIEAASEATRVLISQSSKELLEQTSDFNMEFKGYLQLENKEESPTFWLLPCSENREDAKQ